MDVIINFAVTKSNLAAKETEKLNESITFLKEKSDVKISLISHSDKSEKVMTGLSQKRLDQVGKYLISKGISDKRISSEDAKDSKPIDTSGTKENRDLNMVVEIKFSK